MSILEAGLRGGAMTILLLLAALLVRDSGRSPAGRNCVLLLLSTAGYVVLSAPGFVALDTPFGFSLLIVSLGAPALFWMAAAALFDDALKPSWYRCLAWFGLVALGLWSIKAGEPLVELAYYALSLLFVGLGARHALVGSESDLVEARQRLRVLVALASALYAAAIIIANMLSPGSSVSASFSTLNAVALVATAFACGVAWMDIVPARPIPANADPTSSMRVEVGGTKPPAPPPGDEETALLALGIPEYRLRRLVNRRLGHRNFSSFVNGYRLAEARAALADPLQAEVPILTIALDAGFQSLAPFNRAFKTTAGMTPSQYRRAQFRNR
jgi:AraC-like DNA-binding protein